MLPSDLPHECKLIYIYFRRWVDYDSGCVGYTRRVSYQSIREFLEYLPHRNSNEIKKIYSRDQIKRYLSRLINAGFIEPLHDRTSPRNSMIFKLSLMDIGGVRPHEARHKRATRSPPHENPVTTGPGGVEPARSAPQEARHTSVLSDISNNKCINKYIYTRTRARAGEVIPTDWKPPDDLVDRLSMLHRLSVGVVERKGLEFRVYWRDRGDARVDWEWLFSEYVANSPEAAASCRKNS
ncbi:DnaT-like ssDNA-binding domain-containing protein [Exilibacterium tricleocarpae]|uniref:DnaT-like ssDNA-binding domain-containing protein n=1 Tax=Exilibacterium tricleocarpae TaxID=2591008 RepID=UPI003CCC48BC